MEIKLKKSWQNLSPGDTIELRDELALEVIKCGIAEPVREEREFATDDRKRTAEGYSWD